MAEVPGGVLLRQVRRLVAVHQSGRLNDRQLLEAYLARQDESAFAALVQRHGPGVLSLCRSLLHHLQDAEDVFQATFLVLARKASSIRKRDALGSWLYGVAQRLAAKVRARAARRGGQELAQAGEVEARSADDLTWRELRVVLHEELGRLPEKYRAPLLLCYWEGKTQEEAAARLGCKKGTLKDRVQRARELLRGRLSRRGVSLSAGLVTAMLCGRTGTAAEALALVNETTRAALAFAAGSPTAAASAAAALAEGGIRAMCLSKLKIVTAVLVAVGLLGTGAGVVTQQATSAGEAVQAGKAKPATTDKDRIQGLWVARSMEKGTQPAPKEILAALKLEFAGDKIIAHGGPKPDEGRFTLRPKGRPKEIDLVRGDKVYPGIYELQGDVLTLCINDPGQERPTEFKTAAGSEQVLLVLRREKAPSKAGGASAKLPDDPALLKQRIRELQEELRAAHEQLRATRMQLEEMQLQVQRSQREAQAQRDQAERARQQAQIELERQRALAEQAARLEAARRLAAEAERRVANARQAGAGGDAQERVMNRLKQMALAMHQYLDTNKTFPPAAIYSKDGKPLLSWRVAILPYIEQQDLYKEFKLDEPWDSPHNKKLLAKMPKMYASIKAGAKAGTTPYRVFAGKGAIFDGKEGSRIQDITDGTSNTVLIVEAADAVPWTKPDELPLAAGKPLSKLGGQVKGGFCMATADGAAHFIRTPINEEAMRAVITRGGGEVVNFDDLSKKE